MLLNTVYSKALIARKQRKMGMTDNQGKRALDSNRDTDIVSANLKAFVPLHLDLDFQITFLKSSGRDFILSRENGRVKIAYLACLNWKMCS